MARTYLCSGNGDEKVLGIVFENVLAEMKAEGRSPLLIYTGNPPFTMEPFRMHQRDIVLRFFDRCAATRVPAIGFERLLENLSETRKRRLYLSEERRYSDIVLYGGAKPAERYFDYADEVLLLTHNDASSPGWVYNTLKNAGEMFSKEVKAVVVNATRHESAAVFFYLLKEEIETLLGHERPLFFTGHVRLDQDQVKAALSMNKTITDLFPGSRFHGEIKYVVRNLPRKNGTESRKTLFERLITEMEKKTVSFS